MNNDYSENLGHYIATATSNTIVKVLTFCITSLVPTFFTHFQGKKVLVIGTTSELTFLDSVGLRDAFSVTYNVPTLKTEDARKVHHYSFPIVEYTILDSFYEPMWSYPFTGIHLLNICISLQEEHDADTIQCNNN